MSLAELPPRQRDGPEKKRKKETLQFRPIELICHGVEVVEMTTGERKYHVTWERDNTVAHNFFDHIQPVLNQHERVIESKLGTVIDLANRGLLRIPGETQKMADLSSRLSNLASQYLALLPPRDFTASEEELEKIIQDLGRVSNEYKREAQANLKLARSTSDESKRVAMVLKANTKILQRNEQCIGIVQGTRGRFGIVSQKRDEWEGMIEKSFNEIAEELGRLESGGLTVHDKEQMARHVSGKRYGVMVRLNEIEGPEYWQRIQTPDVQNLANFGADIRKGDDLRAKEILRNAILELERVVKEKKDREKAKERSKR